LVSKLGDEIIDIDWTIKEGEGFQANIFGSGDLQANKAKILKKISQEQKEFFNPDSDKKKLAADIRKLKIDLLINQLELMVTTKGLESKPTGTGKQLIQRTELHLQTLGWKDTIKQLKKLKDKPDAPLHFFDWKLDFPEVLNEQINSNSGFDIVIANPPYIKEYTNRDAFEGFRQSPYYQGKMDIWYGFACKMFDHLKQSGIECFIAQNNWITSAGASILRDKILQEGRIKIFTDFGNYKVFNSAGIQTMVHLIKKENPSEAYTTRYTLLKNDTLSQQELINVLEFNNSSEYTDKFLFSFNPNIFIGKSISFNESNLSLILDKIENESNFQLADKEVIQGIVGAPDEAFLVEKKDLKNFNKEEMQFIKPYYTNASGISDCYIIYLSDKNFRGNKLSHYPNLNEHFRPFKKELEIAKIKYKTPSKPYFYLHRERDESFFTKGEKIICQIRSQKPNFYYTTKEYYVSRAVNIIKSKRISLKFLSLLLNSNLTYFFYKNRGASQGNILKFDKGPLLTIPIKSTKNINKFESYFDNLLQLKEEGKSTLIIQNKIDNLVYKLYELTYDEVKVIDPEFSLSKKEYEAIKLE
jgi:adenine-specific DNA-methyltransferase